MNFLSTDTALRICLKQRKLLSNPRPYVFVAAMPKSASTFLHRVLMNLTGFGTAYFASAYGNIEQELYRPRLIDSYDAATVTQQHVRANHPNLKLMEQFRIRPVVLVRNVHDIIISMRDHLLNERLDNLPGLYVPEEFPEFDTRLQLDFVVTYAAPWLISFYYSWLMAEKSGRLDVLWLNYEVIVADWPAALKRVLRYYDIEKSDAEIETALSNLAQKKKSQLRLNKGISGRGAEELSAEQRQQIYRMTLAYPGIDFSAVGISTDY